MMEILLLEYETKRKQISYIVYCNVLYSFCTDKRFWSTDFFKFLLLQRNLGNVWGNKEFGGIHN